MKYSKIRKLLNILLMVFGSLIFFQFACFIGAGGILNELDQAIAEIEKLEEENNLENISHNDNYYIKRFHNSPALRQHIKDYEKELHYQEIGFCILIVLFFFCLFLRIYFRKKPCQL